MNAESKPTQSQRTLVFAEIEMSRRLDASRRRSQYLHAVLRGRALTRLRYACIGAVLGTVIGDQSVDLWLDGGILGGYLGLMLAACLEVRRVLAR